MKYIFAMIPSIMLSRQVMYQYPILNFPLYVFSTKLYPLKTWNPTPSQNRSNSTAKKKTNIESEDAISPVIILFIYRATKVNTIIHLVIRSAAFEFEFKLRTFWLWWCLFCCWCGGELLIFYGVFRCCKGKKYKNDTLATWESRGISMKEKKALLIIRVTTREQTRAFSVAWKWSLFVKLKNYWETVEYYPSKMTHGDHI